MKIGDRFNQGKLKWSLVCYKSLEPMVEVLMFGAIKYAPHNWKKGLLYTEICESMLRHIYNFLDGRNRDKESRLLEVGHIMCNALFLSFMYLFRPDLDDRENPDSREDEVTEDNKNT